MKIMINDDLELVTRQLKYILEREFDYEILVFNDSREAIGEYGRDNSIDIVLTDLKMPDMNGIEFAIELHKMSRIDDAGIKIPPKIILVTAVDKDTHKRNPDSALLNLAINSGYFEEVISKPINRNELVLSISKIISKNNLAGFHDSPDVPSVETICHQIDQAVAQWDTYALDAFQRYLVEQIEFIDNLQSKDLATKDETE